MDMFRRTQGKRSKGGSTQGKRSKGGSTKKDQKTSKSGFLSFLEEDAHGARRHVSLQTSFLEDDIASGDGRGNRAHTRFFGTPAKKGAVADRVPPFALRSRAMSAIANDFEPSLAPESSEDDFTVFLEDDPDCVEAAGGSAANSAESEGESIDSEASIRIINCVIGQVPAGCGIVQVISTAYGTTGPNQMFPGSERFRGPDPPINCPGAPAESEAEEDADSAGESEMEADDGADEPTPAPAPLAAPGLIDAPAPGPAAPSPVVPLCEQTCDNPACRVQQHLMCPGKWPTGMASAANAADAARSGGKSKNPCDGVCTSACTTVSCMVSKQMCCAQPAMAPAPAKDECDQVCKSFADGACRTPSCRVHQKLCACDKHVKNFRIRNRALSISDPTSTSDPGLPPAIRPPVCCAPFKAPPPLLPTQPPHRPRTTRMSLPPPPLLHPQPPPGDAAVIPGVDTPPEETSTEGKQTSKSSGRIEVPDDDDKGGTDVKASVAMHKTSREKGGSVREVRFMKTAAVESPNIAASANLMNGAEIPPEPEAVLANKDGPFFIAKMGMCPSTMHEVAMTFCAKPEPVCCRRRPESPAKDVVVFPEKGAKEEEPTTFIETSQGLIIRSTVDAQRAGRSRPTLLPTAAMSHRFRDNMMQHAMSFRFKESKKIGKGGQKGGGGAEGEDHSQFGEGSRGLLQV